MLEQQLRMLTESRDCLSKHIRASQEMIEQSRALIAQLDEQIKRMEREMGWFGRLTK
jgi:hypothetical protein